MEKDVAGCRAFNRNYIVGGYPVSKGILVQVRLFIHVFRILFTIIHSNTYLEKGLSYQ